MAYLAARASGLDAHAASIACWRLSRPTGGDCAAIGAVVLSASRCSDAMPACAREMVEILTGDPEFSWKDTSDLESRSSSAVASTPARQGAPDNSRTRNARGSRQRGIRASADARWTPEVGGRRVRAVCLYPRPIRELCDEPWGTPQELESSLNFDGEVREAPRTDRGVEVRVCVPVMVVGVLGT